MLWKEEGSMTLDTNKRTISIREKETTSPSLQNQTPLVIRNYPPKRNRDDRKIDYITYIENQVIQLGTISQVKGYDLAENDRS